MAATTMTMQTIRRDMTIDEYIERIDMKSFRSYVKLNMSKDKLEVYKAPVERYELETHLAAGDCAVDIIGKIVEPDKRSPSITTDLGIIMPLEHGLSREEASDWTVEKRTAVSHELIALLQRLHEEKRIIFGDVKPLNFLWCQAKAYRFCDFGEARMMHWDAETYKNTMMSDHYVSPKRWDDAYHRPTTDDDWYSMALTIWSLYTGRLPPSIHARTRAEVEDPTLYKPIDINDIVDDEIRNRVRIWLVNGGASY